MTPYLIALLFQLSYAAEGLQTVQFEWDPIPQAKSYDIEVTNQLTQKIVIKKSQSETLWTEKLPIGKYMIRLRSRDKRNAPGPWSEKMNLELVLNLATLIKPSKDEKIHSQQEDKDVVQFLWNAVAGADYYQFSVSNESGQLIYQEEVSHNEKQISLPVANQYIWTVEPRSKSGAGNEGPTRSSFILMGKAIDKPNIKRGMSEGTSLPTLVWSSAHAESYDFMISKWNEKKWTKISSEKKSSQTSANIDEKYIGGKYRIAVRAHGKYRASSSVADLKFQVEDQNRFPASASSTYNAVLWTRGWYGIASWMVTNLAYQGTHADSSFPSATFPSATSGIGRLGVGYLGPESNWGFLGIADLGGVLLKNSASDSLTNHTFASVETNVIYRAPVNDSSEIRQQAGLFVKEIPEIIFSTSTQFSTEQIEYSGLKYGIEYWLGVTNKIGLQTNAHLYYNLMTMRTPNGQKIQPSLTTQLGVMGSYRISPKTTGLIGYTYRKDEVSYPANSGATNSFNYLGHYLNLFLEFSL